MCQGNCKRTGRCRAEDLEFRPSSLSALTSSRLNCSSGMGLAEEKALAIFASHADERGFVSGLFTSRYNVSAKIVSRSITDLHSGALTLSVPQSATNEQSSLSAGGRVSAARAIRKFDGINAGTVQREVSDSGRFVHLITRGAVLASSAS
jgi:hypothetical protein